VSIVTTTTLMSAKVSENLRERIIEAQLAFVEAANKLLQVWEEDNNLGNELLDDGYPPRWGCFAEEVCDINGWAERFRFPETYIDIEITREEAISLFCQWSVETADPETLLEVFEKGYVGYDSLSDKQLEDEWKLYSLDDSESDWESLQKFIPRLREMPEEDQPDVVSSSYCVKEISIKIREKI
jgi:hypothetical protein